MTATRRPRYTGVCVVRAEPQGDVLLISVTAKPDIEVRTPVRLSRHSTDITATLDLVAAFLREVAALNASDD